MAKILGVHSKAPMTDEVDRGPITILGTTSNPTKANAVNVDRLITWRSGSKLCGRIEYSQIGNTGAAAGSGDYLIDLSAVLTALGGLTIFTPSKVTDDSAVEGGSSAFTISNKVGDGSLNNNTDSFTGHIVVYDTTKLRLLGISVGVAGTANSAGAWGSTYYPLTDSNLNMVCKFEVPITQWSSNDQLRTSDDSKI